MYYNLSILKDNKNVINDVLIKLSSYLVTVIDFVILNCPKLLSIHEMLFTKPNNEPKISS